MLDLEERVIPHLYEAGELGDLFATKYIGGSSVADLLVSGRLAGMNAAKEKNDGDIVDVVSSPSLNADLKTDAVQNTTDFETGPNQYIGFAEQGMGDLPIVVRVTFEENEIKDIEVMQEMESPDVGGKAIPELRDEMLKANSYDVDVISGASATSKGFKNAVKSALEEAKN